MPLGLGVDKVLLAGIREAMNPEEEWTDGLSLLSLSSLRAGSDEIYPNSDPGSNFVRLVLETALVASQRFNEGRRYTSFPRWKIGSTPVARASSACSSCCSRGL
jgi:hypothetical protein